MTKGSSWANYCPATTVVIKFSLVIVHSEKPGDYRVVRQLNLLKDWLRSSRADNK